MPSAPQEVLSKSRGWCFTVNTYDDSYERWLKTIDCQYLIYGREVAPTTGREHLQGYVHFGQPKTRLSVSKLLPRAHLERRMGSIQQAVDYCKKDGDYFQKGEIRIESNTNSEKEMQWKEIIKFAREGEMEKMMDMYPRQYIQYYKTLMSIRAYNSKPLDGDLQHEWWYGPTGTGKSKSVWEKYPDHYAKPLNKWWDGYRGQDVVVIEEWEPKNECTASKLKIWADRYPFPAEIKGGTIERVRPQKIIVTSNYTIKECFPNEQDWKPLERRFTQRLFPWVSDNDTPLFLPEDIDFGDLDAVNELMSFSQLSDI
ncbi:Rep [uncultured virus]|uniref:ATP-dependent helicase Rep n=1 Tax=uncultured virus TaxID=340016 RepID=A0A2K9LT05_9VIRU|nr:Rep [uncultured virus]